MILYHGTNIDFNEIDLGKSNPFKDFGRGFYLTDLKEQATALAVKRAKLFGGSPVVQEYEFLKDEAYTSGLKILNFDKPSKDWAEFIYRNRNREQHFNHDFDIIYGPIANDGVAYLLGRYDEGTITLDELSRELEFKNLNNQYFFGTPRALSFLKRI